MLTTLLCGGLALLGFVGGFLVGGRVGYTAGRLHAVREELERVNIHLARTRDAARAMGANPKAPQEPTS